MIAWFLPIRRRRAARLAGAFVAAALLLVGAGCNSAAVSAIGGLDPRPCGGRCSSSELCYLDQCVKACRSDAQCPPPARCDLFRGMCVGGTTPDVPEPIDFEEVEAGPDTDIEVDTDADADAEPDEDLRDTPDADDGAVDQEDGYKNEDEPCASTAECKRGLACFGENGQNKVCLRRCDPFNPTCTAKPYCHIPETPQSAPDVYGTGQGVCRADNGGGTEGAACGASTQKCRPDFVCLDNADDDRCVKPCRAGGTTGCGADQTCVSEAANVPPLGVGLCLDCTQGAACPDGQTCNAATKKCEQQQTGPDCRQAGNECVRPQFCREENGTWSCKDGCQVTGCAAGFCNRSTGECENVCVPACPAGQCCNQDNVCGECCVPACQQGFFCDNSGAAPVCKEIADCRQSPLPNNGCNTGNGCDPVSDLNCFREECDQTTGLCTKRCPATCPTGTFCDDVRTQFKCRQPDANRRECSPQFPDGVCPSSNDTCVNGRCIPQGSGGGCVNPGDRLSFPDQCCAGATQCGSGFTYLNGQATCCRAGQRCSDPGGIPLDPSNPLFFFLFLLQLFASASCN